MLIQNIKLILWKMIKICALICHIKGTYPIFWKLFYLWTNSNKIRTVYVKQKIKYILLVTFFPVFFLVFFLFTILWTNYDKIVFTQIPKALSVLVLEKKQRVFWKTRYI